MNNLIKGSVAGATGIVLLTGGFGTYALWSDTSTVGTSGVTSGVLDIAAGSTPVWDDTRTPATADWVHGTDLVVPGDVITRTQTFAVTGTGKNLRGTVKLTGGAVNDGGFASTTPSYDWLTVSVAVTAVNGSVILPDTTTTTDLNDFVFEAPFGTDTLKVVVTYTVGDATLQQAQNATATMADATLTIAQTALPTS